MQLHTGAVHAQEWLQKTCEQHGWPVANDPRLGLRATVSRVRGMLMARTHIGLGLDLDIGLSLDTGMGLDIGMGIGQAQTELTEELNRQKRQFYCAEPETFQKLRESEAYFHEKGILQRQKEIEEMEEIMERTETMGLKSLTLPVLKGKGGESGVFDPDLCSFDGDIYIAPAGVVMKPREATELLVHTAVELALATIACRKTEAEAEDKGRGKDKDKGKGKDGPVEDTDTVLTILDLGTGSGCVLIAVLQRLRILGVSAFGLGLDCDEAALCVARRNVNAKSDDGHGNGDCDESGNGISGNGISCNGSVHVEAGQVECALALGTFEGFGTDEEPLCFLEGTSVGAQEKALKAIQKGFDLVLCNPPYLDESTSIIDKNVRKRDPAVALFCANGGMQCYREVALNECVLRSAGIGARGSLLMEVPGNGGKRVLEVFSGLCGGGWGQGAVRFDKRGQERLVVF